MAKRLLIYIIIALGILLSLGVIFFQIVSNSNIKSSRNNEPLNLNQKIPLNSSTNTNTHPAVQVPPLVNVPVQTVTNELNKIKLAVPYINEAPDDIWTGPWKNACEEASMAMVEYYYLSKSTVTIKEAKSFMQAMFDTQDKLYGSNADADATRTANLINNYTNYNATIIDNPTLLQIKQELQQKRPVISLHYGFDLQNPNIPFVPAPRGSSYHMMVIIGYDDTTQEFITNDTGDRKDGPGHRYNYDLFLNTLHDFIYAKRQASGIPRVIFTYPKLVKTSDSPQVYYLHNNTKQFIPDEATFTAKGWTWAAVNVVPADWLNKFNTGEDIIL